MSDRTAPDPRIAKARKQWMAASEAEDPQRKRIVAAKKFRALDQWPDAIKIQREGGGAIAGQPPQPPRPCLVVDRLSQPVRQVSNTIKNADFGLDVMPNGQGADTECAEILKGYLRRMQNQARGESPVEWAADGAIEGGLGWCRMRADFVHHDWTGEPTEELFDQELRLERITNNLTVYCDPSAISPTRREALFMFIVEDMARDAFEEKYPDADLRGLEEFHSTGDMQDWVSDKTIRIAEWWTVDFDLRPFYWLKTGEIGEGKPPKGADVRMSRVMRVPKVKGCKINAVEVLPKAGGGKEEWDWPGRRIPIFPVIGEELNVDGKTWLRGIIEMGMDAQRMVNYTYSGAVEIYALSAKKAPMIPGAAVENYKGIWQTRTIVNHSYLPYDPWDEQGRALPSPTLDTTDAPIQASVALMQVSEDAIKASTSTGDASLGNTNPNERSGKALNALQQQSDLANSNYPDNVRRALIAIAEEAVYVIPRITRPGQILHILGMDDKPEQVMVGKPFKPNDKGAPEPAPDDITAEIAKIEGSQYKFYDLNNGTYTTTATVGKATATRQQEGAQALGELIPHLPPEMQAKVMPDYIKQLSFPGAQGIAEKLEPPTNEGLPPQVQQLVAQLQQQNQQLQQMVQTDQIKAQATMQAAHIKAQADLQIAQFEAQKEIELAHLENAAKIEVARIGAAKAVMDTQAAGQEERLATGLQIQHEQRENALDRQHEAGLTALQQAHQADQAAQGQAAQASEADAARAHEAEQADIARQAAAKQGGES